MPDSLLVPDHGLHVSTTLVLVDGISLSFGVKIDGCWADEDECVNWARDKTLQLWGGDAVDVEEAEGGADAEVVD